MGDLQKWDVEKGRLEGRVFDLTEENKKLADDLEKATKDLEEARAKVERSSCEHKRVSDQFPHLVIGSDLFEAVDGWKASVAEVEPQHYALWELSPHADSPLFITPQFTIADSDSTDADFPKSLMEATESDEDHSTPSSPSDVPEDEYDYDHNHDSSMDTDPPTPSVAPTPWTIWTTPTMMMTTTTATTTSIGCYDDAPSLRGHCCRSGYPQLHTEECPLVDTRTCGSIYERCLYATLPLCELSS